jgi:hypothetical protein
VIKGCLTELGVDAANLALQCLGGHGYMREWGLEQNVRDARIATIYEGTTGIQALDLLGRKVVRDGARGVRREAERIVSACDAALQEPELAAPAQALKAEVAHWVALSERLVGTAGEDPCTVPAAATDYLMYTGYLLLGHGWLQSARAAGKAESDRTGNDHSASKPVTAAFYFDRMFPRAASHRAMIDAGPGSLVAAQDPYLRPLETDHLQPAGAMVSGR